jgi:3-oxoacyl-[acyl-carrier-protein] synthase II
MTDLAAVAIIGMAGRFPGARNIDEYWRNLRDGVCSIVDFDDAELSAAGVGPDELRSPGYVAAGGYLSDADRFEAELFGFNRTEAAALDPQHRLLLETAWSCLEDAGYNPRKGPERTGVYVGGGLSEHMTAAFVDQQLTARLGFMQLRILNDRDFLASWISYKLGLDGPSIGVQTACSTALAAVHLASQALLVGDCDTALAGGVAVDSVYPRGYTYQTSGVLSPDGRCRPFDEKAAGTVRGNGAGLVVLRRLEDALADGDPIRAVIRGTAVTNDGAAKVGFTAPSVDRQTAAIVEAWSAAGLDPTEAQYLEMHGTGTEIGDRIEVAAAAAALGGAEPGQDATGPDRTGKRDKAGCAMGSVKSNLGHLDAAAGAASLIKVVLMLEHGLMAPTVNVTRPHPDLALGDTPFHLVTEPTAWERPDGGSRLAGVSAVGIGGTNVHVVVEEAPVHAAALRTESTDLHSGLELLPISARTTPQLASVARDLACALLSSLSSQTPALALSEVAHTLRTARAAHECRGYVIAGSIEQAAAALNALADGLPATNAMAGDTSADLAHADYPVLRSLGDAWVAGQDVAWPEANARRVHLPTYPFAGESFGALRLVRGAPVQSISVQFAPDQDAAAAEQNTEEAVAELLQTTLGLTGPEGLDQSYLAAGGDSLTAVHLAGILRDDFGLDVPITVFLDQVTLRELAVGIASGQTGAGENEDLLAALLDEIESSQ